MSWNITVENEEVVITLSVEDAAVSSALAAAAAAEASKLAAQQAETDAQAAQALSEIAATASETAQQLSEDASSTASTQAGIATTQAGIATTQAGIATTQAGIATTQASNSLNSANDAADSAAAALASENAAAADALATAADRVQTGQDRVATGQDRSATAADALATAADRVQTGLDRVATGQDRVQTGLDRVATAADRVQTNTDANVASTQAGVATTQAGIATTQAGIATTQAGIATTQASNALSSANAASASATNALNSANAAAASAASAAQVGTSTLLTGLTIGPNQAITATDSILTAFGEVQAQINARAVISGTPAAGQVAFWGSASAVAGNANLVYNSTTRILSFFDIPNGGTIDGTTISRATNQLIVNAATELGASIRLGGSERNITITHANITTRASTHIWQAANGANLAQLFASGNLLIQVGAGTDAGFRLDVNGTARITGALTTNLTAGRVPFVGTGGVLSDSAGLGLAASVNTELFITGITGQGQLTIRDSTLARSLNITTNNAASFITTNASLTVRVQEGGNFELMTTNSNTRRLVILNNGNVLINTNTSIASSLLTVESTTQGVLFPRMTSTQRNAISSPATGLVVYNTTDNRLSVFNGTAWVNISTI